MPGAIECGAGGLSDFGGDVSQYMSLLTGTSAFSFRPAGTPTVPDTLLGEGEEDEEEEDGDEEGEEEVGDVNRSCVKD